MKAHKSSYVNKTNEKPVLRGEGVEGKKETLRDLLFVKGCSIYSRHWRKEWWHHSGGITEHLLMAGKNSTPRAGLTAQRIEKGEGRKTWVGTTHAARL